MQLHRKPSVQYWVGHGIFYVGIFVVLWILAFHFALVARALRRSNAALVMVIIPAASLALTCQVQEIHVRSVAASLLSLDCTSFESKAVLERAWTSAQDILSNCSSALSDATGASPSDTRRILRLQTCPGYTEGYATYGAEWDYLAYMEKEHHCGGWCESRRAVWQPSGRVGLPGVHGEGASLRRLVRVATGGLAAERPSGTTWRTWRRSITAAAGASRDGRSGSRAAEWDYLAYMEKEHHCGGWCESRRAVWQP